MKTENDDGLAWIVSGIAVIAFMLGIGMGWSIRRDAARQEVCDVRCTTKAATQQIEGKCYCAEATP
jgi:hypothetical protein